MDNRSPENMELSGIVDITQKPVTSRVALARGQIYLSQASIQAIQQKTNPKGDVLEIAKIAAIHAVKKTPDLVTFAHPIPIHGIKVFFEVLDDRVDVSCRVASIGKTGVEIEAVAGVMNALLAIFDVSKRYEKDKDGQYPVAKIGEIKVVDKKKEEI